MQEIILEQYSEDIRSSQEVAQVANKSPPVDQSHFLALVSLCKGQEGQGEGEKWESHYPIPPPGLTSSSQVHLDLHNKVTVALFLGQMVCSPRKMDKCSLSWRRPGDWGLVATSTECSAYRSETCSTTPLPPRELRPSVGAAA